MKNLIFVFSSICFFLSAQGLEIPTGLKNQDLPRIVKILGIPTSTKMLSNPYPLGGYDGLELSLSFELIRTTDLAHLGDKTSTQREFQFPRLTVGKGLYNNIDFFFHFVPYSEESQVSEYGGLARWGFYQGKFLPITWSAIIHGNSINVADQFLGTTLGAELMVGLNAEDFSLYLGYGTVDSDGEFVQTILDATDTTIDYTSSGTAQSNVQQNKSFVGINFQLTGWFIALQVDRYDEPVYSAKVGLSL